MEDFVLWYGVTTLDYGRFYCYLSLDVFSLRRSAGGADGSEYYKEYEGGVDVRSHRFFEGLCFNAFVMQRKGIVLGCANVRVK